MSARSVLLAVLALALASTGCQPPGQAPAGLSEEDDAAIRARTEGYVQAALAGDAAAVSAFFSEDALRMPPDQPAVEGRAAIQAWHEAVVGAGTYSQFTATPVQIEGRGDLAFVRGTFSITWTPQGAPEPIQITGKYVEIRRKQADGSWLIAADIWNWDHPLPEEGSGT
ncbi:MAG: SgcJ/EcaC family oxidoreductase [Gemmatimonadota bacterium]|nr:MAG: SgcJ/EcaC family oxidoreductase [Gemmatimonadota bacterium]